MAHYIEKSEVSSWIEGVSNEVVTTVIVVVISTIALFLITKARGNDRATDIHPDSEDTITAVRAELERRYTNRQHENDDSCPVCLGAVLYGLETNCGHLFCGTCIIAYWRTGRWLGPVACPVCRQTVTVLLTSFTDIELQEEDSDEKNTILEDVHGYNRRFSGEPRSIREYISDLPTVLRHTMSDLFSMDGMIFMFRIRIIVCIVLALLYFLSPFDIIPEVAVGLLGFLDDLFIMFIVAIYISIIYRGVLANRGNAET